MKTNNVIFAELRRQNIASLVNEKGVVSVSELCSRFSVSPATIRNDLTELERLGALQRTHGGAIRRQHFTGIELTSTEKETHRVHEKREIAKAALQFINPGDVIALDTGTTTLELAKLLREIRDITVITNDLTIASVLESDSAICIILLGGMIRHRFHCTVGRSVKDQLGNIHVDKLFLATNGMSEARGFSTPSIENAEVKRAMTDIAGKVFMLSDSSKVNNEALISFGELSSVNVLITDSGIDSSFADAVRRENIELICV